jgi:outer membrane receptor protein involved in Fe transport
MNHVIKDSRWIVSTLRFLWHSVASAVVGLSFIHATFAQTAAISGTVKDQSGALVPGVQITVTHTETAQKRSAVTDERGDYLVPLLPVGNYEVLAAQPGFKTSVRRAELQVGDTSRVDFELSIGQATEHVLVTEAVPLVQSESSSVGTVVENRRIVELPLNGREFQNLTLLVPGTANPAQGSTLGFRGGITVAGTREEMTSFTLDGVDIVSGLVKAISFKPSIDMIQEFKVQTSTYSAEFGRTAGGQITATTKSGTNNLHGTMYEFLRNSVLDAKNLFDPAGPIPGFKRNNFGATIGGPIAKDRTFFFGNYEGLILRQAQTRTASVPTPEFLSGDFSKAGKTIIDPVTGVPFPGNIIPQDRINPVSRNIINQYPLPNLAGDPSRNYVSTPTDRRDIHQFTVRVDHRISDKNNIYVRYSFMNDYEEDPFDIYNGITNLPNYGRADSQRAQSVSIVDTHVFSPTLIGEFRLGYNRFKQIRTQLSLLDYPKLWGISGTTTSPNPRDHGYPAVRVTGYDPIGKAGLPSDRVDPLYQIIGSITNTRGRHTLKFGAEANQYGTMRLNNGGGNGDFTFTGEYTGDAVADLLLGYPRRASRSIGDTRNPMFNESFSFYLQDDWKATPRLTLNLGVRYDLETPFRSADDRLVRFNPNTGAIEIAGNASTRRDIGRVDNPASPQYNAELALLSQGVKFVDLGKRSISSFDKNDVSPRIGLAYRLLGNDRLVLRTGYGVFFNQLLGQYGQTGWNVFPFFITQTFNASLPRPNISIENPFPASAAAATISPSSVVEHYRTGYVQNYNFGFQSTPFSDVLLEVTYAGSVSAKLPASRNLNQPRPSPTGSVASRRPYPQFGNISFLDSTASANFNSLQVRAEKRYTRVLTLAAAYTFSKSMDTTGNGDGDANPPDSLNIRGTMYGVSTFDLKHRLVFSYVYEMPFGSGKKYLANAGRLVKSLAGGWEISGINTIQSGRPFTVVVSADRSNTGNSNSDRPILIGNPNLPASERSVDHWFNAAAFGHTGAWHSRKCRPQYAGRTAMDDHRFLRNQKSLLWRSAECSIPG